MAPPLWISVERDTSPIYRTRQGYDLWYCTDRAVPLPEDYVPLALWTGRGITRSVSSGAVPVARTVTRRDYFDSRTDLFRVALDLQLENYNYLGMSEILEWEGADAGLLYKHDIIFSWQGEVDQTISSFDSFLSCHPGLLLCSRQRSQHKLYGVYASFKDLRITCTEYMRASKISA